MAANRMMLVVVSLLVAGCSGTASQPTGHSCTAVTDCYHGLDAGALQGGVFCLARPGGSCPQKCFQDTDCCGVRGECPPGIKQVCAPLESTPQPFCFGSGAASEGGGGPEGGTADTTA